MKKVPSDIRATLDVLFESLQGLQDGTVQSGEAQAIASVARVICSVLETGVIEGKLREIEERVEAKARGDHVA